MGPPRRRLQQARLHTLLDLTVVLIAIALVALTLILHYHP